MTWSSHYTHGALLPSPAGHVHPLFTHFSETKEQLQQN